MLVAAMITIYQTTIPLEYTVFIERMPGNWRFRYSFYLTGYTIRTLMTDSSVLASGLPAVRK